MADKATKAELKKEIAQRTNDAEIQKIALDIALSGEDVPTAVKAATEEVQSLKTANVAKETKERNKGRKKVQVEYIRGRTVGWRTVYWEDIALKLKERGDVKILKTVE